MYLLTIILGHQVDGKLIGLCWEGVTLPRPWVAWAHRAALPPQGPGLEGWKELLRSLTPASAPGPPYSECPPDHGRPSESAVYAA